MTQQNVSAPVDAAVAELLTACRIVTHQGLVEAFGHLSIRTGDRVVITPRQPVPDVRTRDDLVEIDLTQDPVRIGPDVPPEAFLHVALYRARPDVQAVVRYHGPYELAVSTAVDEFRPAVGYGAYVGVVPVHPDPRLIRDLAAGERVAATLGGAAAVLLRGNGAATVGDSPVEATVRAIFLERAAAATCRIGLDHVRPFSDDEIGYFAGLPDARSAQIRRAWTYHAALAGSAS
jgi:HCOMODA/2-hydroxy-3-carboxy-muconic semialdehyde decarboxylase